MKIALSANQFFDDEGRPLVNGRISVHIHASDVLADIYTLSSHGYVQADNPFITADDGRIPSLFFDATIVDVWVEKQLGDGTYELLDTYQDGFQLPSTKNDTVVYGVSALQDVDPGVGLVCVSGYESTDDAPTRYFVWDSNCALDGDGGVVWESNGGSSGRWVMLWEGATMPSSVYGIQPGVNEANIAAFLDYPDKIGNIAYPQIRRFLKGTYTSNTTYVCTRPVMFDVGAQFVSAVFDIPEAVIPQNTSYVADFLFSDKAEAHSSWFRTVNYWWHCGASRMIIDATNYFTSTDLGTQALIDNVTLEGATRIPTTYVNSGHLKLSACNVIGSEIFSPSSDRIVFENMSWLDNIWTSSNATYYDFGSVSDGHRVEFYSSAVNNQSLAQFRNTEVYVKMREAQIAHLPSSSKVLDLEGRSLGSFSSTSFTKLMNCRVTGNVVLDGTASGFTMQDVVVEGYVSGGTNPVFINTTASLSGTEWTGSLTAYDSTLSGTQVTGAHDITVVGGRWRKSIQNATDNTTNTGTILFRGVELDGPSIQFKTKNLNLVDCGIYQQTIEIYPHLDTTTNKFVMQGRIEHCEVNNTNPIRYKVFHGLDDNFGSCVWAYTWIGNSFFGNDSGLEAEFWLSTDNEYKWIWATGGHYAVYSGNAGLCPKETLSGTYDVNWSQCAYYPDGGEAGLGGYYKADKVFRAMPQINGESSVSQLGTFWNTISPVYPMHTSTDMQFGFRAATNPAPSSYGYGDFFEVLQTKYGSQGPAKLIYV